MVSINDDSLYMYPNFVVSLGPESISMDITFHDFAHVYGIPVSITLDLFSCWNLT